MADTTNDSEPQPRDKTSRDAELSGRAKIKEQALKIGEAVAKGFEGQNDRAEMILDHWDAYNGILSDRQFYNGTSTMFLPFTHDAVEARKTRFSNQLFPANNRYVEVITPNGEDPHATVAILEHHVRRLKLKTQVVEPLIVNGDVEGQYSIYLSWEERTRNVVHRVKAPVQDDHGEELPPEAAEPVDDIEEEQITDSGPVVEVLSDTDLLVLPTTARSIDHAISIGGSVTILRRWSKDEIKRRRDRGEFSARIADSLIEAMGNNAKSDPSNPAKAQAAAAGVKIEKGDKIAVVYEVWTEFQVDGDRRLCRMYYAGNKYVLSVKLCPYWCDKVPVLSTATDPTTKVFKGRPPIADVLDLQIFANDTINEGADTAHFSAMPIIMTDPVSNPRVSSLVLGPAAIWQTNPQSTQFAKFPEMWKDALERVMEIRAQMFQTLSVNPAMIPGLTGGRQKKNQAEIAQEQMVDILTTAAAVTAISENILSPMLERIVEYDHQFRDKAITVAAFGEVGRKAMVEQIEPIQMNRRYEFRWFGVEAARNAAQMQQQIAGLNVLRGIPPAQYPGYKLNLAPAIVQMVENLFGPRLGPLIFSEEEMISVDPGTENEMMEHGFDTPIHPADNDIEHIRVHMDAMHRTGDPHGTLRKHLMLHQKAVQMKAAKQTHTMAGPQGSAAPGAPTPGGQPSGPQSQPGAPGQIPVDQLNRAGAPQLARK